MKKYIFIILAIILFTGCKRDAPTDIYTNYYQYMNELSYDVTIYLDERKTTIPNWDHPATGYNDPYTYDSITFVFEKGSVIFYATDERLKPFNVFNMDNWTVETKGRARKHTYTITKELEKLAK